MNLLLEECIFGEPVAQARPRITRWGAYDPPRSKEYKQYLKKALQNKPTEPYEIPLRFELWVYRKIPKSTSKKRAIEMEQGLILPTVKPDSDNYLKGVLDAFSGVLWKDDSYVTDMVVYKRYSKDPRIEFKLYDIGA